MLKFICISIRLDMTACHDRHELRSIVKLRVIREERDSHVLEFSGMSHCYNSIRDEEPTTTGERRRNNLRAFSREEYARLLACARHARVLYSTDTLGTA